MRDFRKLLRRAERTPAAELEGIRRTLEAEQDAATAEAEALRQRRRAALLSATDAELKAIEAEIEAADLRAERAAEAVAELARRAREAEERERKARVDETYRRGMALQEEGVRLLRDEYLPHASAIALLAQRVVEIEQGIHAVNTELAAAGDLRSIESADLAARPEARKSPLLLSPVIDGLRLPDLDNAEMLMWPPDASIFGVIYTRPAVDFKHVPTNRDPALDDPVPPPAPAVPDYAEHVPSLRKVISRG